MLTSTRVRLRPFKKSDKDTIVSERNVDTMMLSQGGTPFPFVENDYDWWLGLFNPDKDAYLFVIENQETDEIIGHCVVMNIRWQMSRATVAIEIFRPENQGRGYGTEAMSLLIDFIFRQTQINKVFLEVFSFNERAVASYEKCGFQVEGRVREEIFRYGQQHDIILMGLLRREWEALRGGKG